MQQIIASGVLVTAHTCSDLPEQPRTSKLQFPAFVRLRGCCNIEAHVVLHKQLEEEVKVMRQAEEKQARGEVVACECVCFAFCVCLARPLSTLLFVCLWQQAWIVCAETSERVPNIESIGDASARANARRRRTRIS